MPPSALVRLGGELLSAVLDPTVVVPFNRLGFQLHRLGFREEDLDVDLSGRVCLVTGANSGLGFAAASALADLGAEVWLLCRDGARGRAALDAIRAGGARRDVRLARLDVSDLRDVRAFAAGERGALPERIDVLANNAGVLPAERTLTRDGLELTFATNVAGPFLLTRLLLPRLLAAGQGRILHVSSGGMYTAKLSTRDLDWTRRAKFDGVAAYAQTKRMQVVLTELLAERLAGTPVTVNAMHPGWAETPAVRSSIPRFHRVMAPFLRTPEEGADTLVWLAACRRLASSSGLFFFDRRAVRTHVVPWTREAPEERERLWALCCELTGVPAELEEGAKQPPRRR